MCEFRSIHFWNASVRSSADQLLNKTTITGKDYEKQPDHLSIWNCPKGIQQRNKHLFKRICKNSVRTIRVCDTSVCYRHKYDLLPPPPALQSA